MPVDEIQKVTDNLSEEAKEYRQKLTAELAKIDEGIDSMAANIKQASADVKGEYEARLRDLEAQRRLVKIKLEEFQVSSESALETLKSGLETVWDDFVSTFEQISRDFNSQRDESSRKQ